MLAQKLQNETAEQGLGFASMGVGVCSPSGVRLGRDEQQGLSLLGRPTANISTVATANGRYRNVSFIR